jgi:lambda family phage portal protein
VRNYEAASTGRRTQHWARKTSDANTAASPALAALRAHSRDLVRNNPWARNALRVVVRNTVGWGISPKPVGTEDSARLRDAWARWAETTDCDAAGRCTFAGLEKLVMRTVAESGEALVRRRWRRPEDGLALPMQLQVLEPDYLDTNKNLMQGTQGGWIMRGIEFDAIGRRVAYWLFENHPGSDLFGNATSRRVNASEIVHVYDLERAGQDRGVPWLAAAIVNLKEFDEFEDATLMRQKIAACFAAFVTEVDGGGGALGEPDATDPLVETLEPGMIQRLPLGKDIKFASPPATTDDGFSVRTLRRIAAAIGVTYEDLTGDYSQVNFSSARMSRIAHWGNVYDWQWHLMVPQFCDPVWAWAMEAAALAGILSAASDRPRAEWTAQPMAMTDPDREARANVTLVRSGQKTLSQVIREQGGDPDTHLAEYAADLAKLDKAGIWLDTDVRRVSQAGLVQQLGSKADVPADAAPAGGEPPPNGAKKLPPKPPPKAAA